MRAEEIKLIRRPSYRIENLEIREHMLRGRTRRDTNEAAILDSFKRAGWAVLKINEAGAPDAVVFSPTGSPYLIEVKQPKGKLRESQKRFHAKWTGPQIHIVRTIDDVIAMVQ